MYLDLIQPGTWSYRIPPALLRPHLLKHRVTFSIVSNCKKLWFILDLEAISVQSKCDKLITMIILFQHDSWSGLKIDGIIFSTTPADCNSTVHRATIHRVLLNLTWLAATVLYLPGDIGICVNAEIWIHIAFYNDYSLKNFTKSPGT